MPQSEELPPAFRRVDDVCAAGYTGRKRGEVVRTRTVESFAHSYQWLGSVGNRGNGLYREELRQALGVIGRYLAAHQLPPERALLRLDGQYGTGAVLADLAGFSFVMRGKDYAVLDHPLVQTRLRLPPDQLRHRAESQLVRSLYDCPDVPVGPAGVKCRVVVTHPAGKQKSRVGLTRGGVVYELFFTDLPQQAFTAADVVEVYLHRGALRACSRPLRMSNKTLIVGVRMPPGGRSAGRSFRNGYGTRLLELGHHLEPASMRTTEFAPAIAPVKEQTADVAARAPGYRPLATATPWKAGRFSGKDFALQPGGTLCCPAGKTLHSTEQRIEHDGSLRVLYAARIGDCRVCPLREQCQWHGHQTTKPRRVSLLLHPLSVWLGSCALA